MELKTIKCEDCGTIILIWPKQDRLCHNCKQKRQKQSEELKKSIHKAVKATKQGGGLDQWM